MKARYLALVGLAAAGLTAGSSFAAGQNFDVDVTGLESWDAEGDLDNTVLTFDLAADFGLVGGGWVLNGVGWDVTIATVGASWLSEPTISFADQGQLPGLFLSVGAGNDAPGTMAFSSGGVLKLADAAIPDIPIDSGTISLEFFEGFDDVADAVDATWDGTITLQFSQVPAPGALALLGMAGLIGRRRRR